MTGAALLDHLIRPRQQRRRGVRPIALAVLRLHELSLRPSVAGSLAERKDSQSGKSTPNVSWGCMSGHLAIDRRKQLGLHVSAPTAGVSWPPLLHRHLLRLRTGNNNLNGGWLS